MKENVLRAVAVVLWSVAIFEILGGAFVWRVPVDGGPRREMGNISYSFSLYRLPPPPDGPAMCDLAHVMRLSFTMPCDLRPPFIDLAKRYL
jgi:hypothetical protein